MATRRPDFEADVTFFSPEAGGRRIPAAQGLRPDIQYENLPDEVWMVWPRFIGADGNELPDGVQVPQQAKAQFYIVNDELRRTVHRERVREGLTFYVCEGRKRVARCRVTKILGLFDD